ncbi:MAG: WbqC family protein [Prevotella sp.]|nr:WbqC family protein [Prevotella sp.]
MVTALLSTTYFGPVQWYQKLNRFDTIYIERCESFVKQTYRNRCVIATTNGLQTLSIPVEHTQDKGEDSSRLITDIRISNHGNWRHLHWNALMSAYGDSPFFDYYVDDLKPFFEDRWENLFDFNMAITHKMCELLDIHPNILFTESYVPSRKEEGGGRKENTFDSPIFNSQFSIFNFRDIIRPKNPIPDETFTPKTYYQVYQKKWGFQPNLSILDLLFNMGNESILYL